MRYIGNKTKLLDFIRRRLKTRGIQGGTSVDPFTGTASVARALKRWGFRVIAADIMEYSHVLAKTYVEADGPPDLGGLADAVRLSPVTPAGVIAHLNTLLPAPAFIHEHYAPEGTEGRRHGRMYFTPANAARIDAIRTTLEAWRRDGLIDAPGFHFLLTALLEAADRVANTTGVYAAFVKTWQSNARKRLTLRVPETTHGPGSRAERVDALALVRQLEPFDLLYLDPPYNTRQYAGYYHIPEIIALGWFDGPVATRGKTGLIEDRDKRSDWSRANRAAAAFETLVATAPWSRLVMSYNAEGIIPEHTIERVLREQGRAATYRRYRRGYRRYRSDADSETRRYQGDHVYEYLYCVDR